MHYLFYLELFYLLPKISKGLRIKKRIKKTVKLFYLTFLFCFSPILPVNATAPKSVTCTRTEYREEYIPGSKSSPGYVKSYEVDVVIPCVGESQNVKIDNNDCSQGSFIGSILGAGIALSSSRGKDRFWAVPAGGTAGALIGCQVDGG